MSLFNTSEIAFGLDISDRALRLIQLKKKGKKNFVQFYNEIKLPPDCLKNGEINDQKLFLSLLNKLIKTKHGRGKLSDEVIGVLPEEKTFLKVIEIPLVNKNQIPDQIKEILPQHIPVSIDDIYFDWQIIKTTGEAQSVLIGASPKNIVNSYVAVLTQANLMPIALEIESAAIARVLLNPECETKTQIVIDFGATRTGLFLYDEGTIKFTVSLPISGNNITQLIASTLEIDTEKAERAKIVCGFDKAKCHGALLEILSDSINALVNHIFNAIGFYENNFSATKKIEKIMLCGGGANYINISQVLQEKLKIPVAVSDPWQNIIKPDIPDFDSQKAQSFITAMGLALRGLDAKNF